MIQRRGGSRKSWRMRKTEFSYGSMPHHLAERNMRLFADKVMPVLQRDAAFQGIKAAVAAGDLTGER